MKETLATVETCVLCGRRFLNHFDTVSETPYSCDTVGWELQRVILCSLLCPETDWKIRIGKQGYVFILIDFKSGKKQTRQYITKTQTLSNIPASPPSNCTHFFKLPYVGPFSIIAQNRLRKLLKRYCNNLDVKLAFSSFKIRNMFSVKDPAPVELR